MICFILFWFHLSSIVALTWQCHYFDGVSPPILCFFPYTSTEFVLDCRYGLHVWQKLRESFSNNFFQARLMQKKLYICCLQEKIITLEILSWAGKFSMFWFLLVILFSFLGLYRCIQLCLLFALMCLYITFWTFLLWATCLCPIQCMWKSI